MPFKDHIENTLRINPEPPALFKMILSAIGITTPLIIGYFNHQLFVSMFGALMGLVLYLNDHFSNLVPRIKHLTITFLLLMLSLTVGALAVGHNGVILVILLILSFLVGKSKNFGIELERLMLFITLQFLTASSESIIKIQLNSLLIYSLVTFLNYILCATLIYYFTSHQTNKMASKRETIKKILDQNKSLKFPLVCAVFSCMGFILAQMFQFAHANWIVGTAIIVMLPDSYQGIYKSAQRLLGTIIGVVMTSTILAFVHHPAALIAFVFIFSFFMPAGLLKNYWVGNIFIAGLILFFLEIAAPQSIELHHLAFWRIADIAIGSTIGVLASICLKPTLLSFKKTK